jgi:transcriptional regulator with XRE-family HTH domain
MTLKDARRALGWTQQQLEAASGVKQQHISDLERGEIGRVSYEAVSKLLRAFHKAGLKGLTADDLVEESKERAS